MSQYLLAMMLSFAIVGWIGYIVYNRVRLRTRAYRRCRHCDHAIRSTVTYCPRCGEVVSSGSSRR
jgi:hypothetical protein